MCKLKKKVKGKKTGRRRRRRRRRRKFRISTLLFSLVLLACQLRLQTYMFYFIASACRLTLKAQQSFVCTHIIWVSLFFELNSLNLYSISNKYDQIYIYLYLYLIIKDLEQ